MFWLIINYCGVFLAVILVLWYLNLYWCNRGLTGMPGPTPLPLIGNAFAFLNSVVVLQSLQKYEKKYNCRTLKYTIGTETIIVSTDYKLTEKVHTQILEKSPVYLFLVPWLGLGLLTSGGEKWKKHRKMLTPTFHFSILEQYIDIFSSACDVLTKQLRKEVGKPYFDAYKYINLCAMDIICESAMGVTVNAQTQDSAYLRAVKSMCKLIINRILSPVSKYSWYYWMTPTYYLEQRNLKVIHNHTNSVIQSRRKELLAEENPQKAKIVTHSDNKGKPEESYGIKKKMVFLDLLLKSTIDGKPLTDEDIREEVDTFMFEGHDTVTSAISFAIHCLAKYPECQAKIVDELRLIFGKDRKRRVTYKDHQEMKYLEMFIKEVLRLYPSVPFYMRMVTERTEYEGMVFEPNLTISMFLYGLHRNPEYFPDPEVFDPERFSPSNNVGKYPYSYIPFSAGPRNCIGQRFAMLELKTTLSKILLEFEVLPVIPAHEPILGVEVILKPINGILVRVENRRW